MKNDNKPKNKEEKKQKEIKFDFIKSNFYRVIHANGVWGSLTPNLDIQAAFFTERLPIPQQIFQEISENGLLGKENIDKRVSRDGIVREVEANIIMDSNTAKSVIVWLSDKVKEAERIIKEKEENNNIKSKKS